MRLKICCCYCTDEGPALNVKDNNNGATLPRIVAEQPKLGQSIQLDRTTSVSPEESAVPKREDKKEEEAPRPMIPEKEIREFSAPPDVQHTMVKPEKEIREFSAPPAIQHTIVRPTELETPQRKEDTHFKPAANVQRAPPSQHPQAAFEPSTCSDPSPASSVTSSDDEDFEEQGNRATNGRTYVINNTTTNVRNNATIKHGNSGISFDVIAPGHMKTIYNGTEYYILNGEIEQINGPCDESDIEHVLTQYEAAMNGVQRAMLGLEKGLLGLQMHNQQSKMQNLLAALQRPMPQSQQPQQRQQPQQPQQRQQRQQPQQPQPPQSRMDVEKFKKLLEQMRNEVHNETLDASRSKTEIRSEKIKTSYTHDELDGTLDELDKTLNELDDELAEPVLEKTTFTPKELVYEDPKTYEPLDSHEVPDAKRVDEYIISRDEQSDKGNAFYFHPARPTRVHRKSPDFNERLRIASPNRYSIFEAECLKEHNKYRSMHGVPPLVHSPFLCKVAKEWAEHLAKNDAFYHRPKNDYGENLYRATKLSVSGKSAVKSWYDEIELYDYDNPGFDLETGHFTQLIWRDTTEMGTGVAQIGEKIWVVCNYHPRGNYTDKFDDEHVPRLLATRIG